VGIGPKPPRLDPPRRFPVPVDFARAQETALSGTAWLGIFLAAGALAGAAAAIHLLRFRRWYEGATVGAAYYGRPAPERAAFKEELRARSRLVVRLAALRARLAPPRGLPSAEVHGIHVPAQTRPAFERAMLHRPEKGDVFVATQMKCGTTWMQQVVYEVLSHGRGDLGDAGHRHLYALSPWLEAPTSVRVEDAPRVGARGHRMIKTHLPASHCPFSEEALYVYVTRQPVACFASTVDFVRMLMGPIAPALPGLVDWFCSDRMWWRPWPDHVEGWWRLAAERPNVLFVHYEEMLADLPACVDRVAAFLGETLSGDEREAVVFRSGFAQMKAHEELFEMHPPTPFSVGGGAFLKSGRGDREGDVGAAERERILSFCRERLRGAAYPAARFYPELGASGR
jgi:hypothetical protein